MSDRRFLHWLSLNLLLRTFNNVSNIGFSRRYNALTMVINQMLDRLIIFHVSRCNFLGREWDAVSFQLMLFMCHLLFLLLLVEGPIQRIACRNVTIFICYVRWNSDVTRLVSQRREILSSRFWCLPSLANWALAFTFARCCNFKVIIVGHLVWETRVFDSLTLIRVADLHSMHQHTFTACDRILTWLISLNELLLLLLFLFLGLALCNHYFW